MRQAIEIGTISGCRAGRRSWRSRLFRWVFGRSDRAGLIPLDHRSAHLLRDIGLAEDVQANDLLREQHFIRR